MKLLFAASRSSSERGSLRVGKVPRVGVTQPLDRSRFAEASPSLSLNSRPETEAVRARGQILENSAPERPVVSSLRAAILRRSREDG